MIDWGRLEQLGRERAEAKAAYDDAHERAIAFAVGELEAASVYQRNTTRAAKLIGVSKQTLYNRGAPANGEHQ
jgi:hypothetical protein